MKTTITIRGVVANKGNDIVINIDATNPNASDAKALAKFVCAFYSELINETPSFLDRLDKLIEPVVIAARKLQDRMEKLTK